MRYNGGENNAFQFDDEECESFKLIKLVVLKLNYKLANKKKLHERYVE